MPSLIYTPGALALSGGEFNPEPIRFSYTPGRLILTGSTSINAGPSVSVGIGALLAAVLDALSAGESIVDQQGRPTRRFQQIWQNAMAAIKDAFSAQGGQITELQAIYAAINVAQSTAATAVQTANETQAYNDIANSYTDPVTVISASSSGTISVTAHTRNYPSSGTAVSVDAGSVGGFAPGTYVTVFYSDPARAGGAVTYEGTTEAVAQTGSTHIVGAATIPQAGSPDAVGAGTTAPGGVPPFDWEQAYLLGYR